MKLQVCSSQNKAEESHEGSSKHLLALSNVDVFLLFLGRVPPSLFLLLQVTGTVSSKWDAQDWRCGPGWAVCSPLLLCLSRPVVYIGATSADLPRVSPSEEDSTGEINKTI